MTDAVLSLLTSFLGTCCANTQTLDIGQHTYRVSHQLGEGGFSTVYLVTDTVRGTQLAMKKIYCHTPDMFAKAQQEIAAYRRFQHRNIIRLVDVLVEEAAVRTVYMVLPLYKENLFDVAEHSRMAEMFWPEDRVMAVFKGVCEAVEYLHNYGKHQSRSERRRQQRQQTTEQEEGDGTEQFLDTATTTTTEASEDDPRQKPKKRGGYAPVGNADDAESAATHAPAASYAHRDIKLANVMLAD
ncbi:Serine/threonine-protein kinase env7, partial [Linderina macrospora]